MCLGWPRFLANEKRVVTRRWLVFTEIIEIIEINHILEIEVLLIQKNIYHNLSLNRVDNFTMFEINKCFLFQWFGLTLTPPPNENKGSLWSSLKITEIPVIFFQNVRSELFVVVLRRWPSVIYAFSFLLAKLLFLINLLGGFKSTHLWLFHLWFLINLGVSFKSTKAKHKVCSLLAGSYISSRFVHQTTKAEV